MEFLTLFFLIILANISFTCTTDFVCESTYTLASNYDLETTSNFDPLFALQVSPTIVQTFDFKRVSLGLKPPEDDENTAPKMSPAATANAIIKADVLIFGGGPAGLATAQALARQLFTTIVFSDHTTPGGVGFRNARTKHMHNVPGWDHKDPAEYRAKARADILARYNTIEFRDVGIKSVKNLSVEGEKTTKFEAVDAEGVVYHGRKLVVASGIRDVMPEEEIPGYSKLWGRTIYHCLFCHGFEERGHPSSAVLATGMLANAQFATGIARMAGRLADTIRVYTNGNETLGRELQESLKNTKSFQIVTDKIIRVDKDPEVEGDAGLLVTLDGGKVNKEGFMANMPQAELNGPFVKDLGLKVTPGGWIEVDSPMLNTNVPGVKAAGDVATMMRAVSSAVYQGGCVAAGISHEITAEDDVCNE